MEDVTWRVTADEIDAVRMGNQEAVESMLRMLNGMATAGGEYVIRCTFPGPQAGGGFAFTVRRFRTDRWWAWLLWWLGAAPIPAHERVY